MKVRLIATTFLEAQNILVQKKSYDGSGYLYLREEERIKLDEQIKEIAHRDHDPVGMLSGAIAHNIFGHEDIKRALGVLVNYPM